MPRVELDGLFDVGDHVADVDRVFIQKHEKSFRVCRGGRGLWLAGPVVRFLSPTRVPYLRAG